MSKMSMNLQDSFLNQVRKENTEIRIQFLSGAELVGLVRGFDNFTIVIHSKGIQHLVYKHGIAQIVGDKVQPRRPRERAAQESKSAPKPNAPEASEESKFNTLDLSSVKVDEPVK